MTDWYLDKDRPIANFDRKLPHWFQSGKLQFVTFRLADSLPRDVINQIRSKRAELLSMLHRNIIDQHRLLTELSKLRTHAEKDLDNGYGECLLADPAVRSIVTETMHYTMRDNAYLLSYVVMPNHVHLLFAPNEDISHLELIHTIKGRSAYEINKSLERRGKAVWQRDLYDRIVRDTLHLNRIMDYIRNNPRNLTKSSYSLWTNPDFAGGGRCFSAP